MPTRQEELKALRIATGVVVVLAVVAFFVQRFVVQFFDLFFEICIFYVPVGTVVALLFYVRARAE